MFKNTICYAPDDGSGAGAPEPTASNDSMDIAALFDLAGPTLVPPEPQTTAGAGDKPNEQQPAVGGQTPPAAGAPNPSVPMAQPVEQTPAQPTAEQLAELKGQLAAWQQVAQRQQPAQPAAQPQQQAPRTAAEIFPVQIPDELVQAIRADDPVMARRGLEHLGSQLGARVLQETQQMVMGHLQQLAQAIPNTITSMLVQHQQMRQWHDDFYKQFPQLGATDELKQFVGQMAYRLGQQGKIAALDKPAMQTVARAVMEAILGPGRVPAPGAVQPQPAPAAPKRPAVAGNSSRQMANGTVPDQNSPAAIMEILFGG